MKGGRVGKCRSVNHRLLELRSGSLAARALARGVATLVVYEGLPKLSGLRSEIVSSAGHY